MTNSVSSFLPVSEISFHFRAGNVDSTMASPLTNSTTSPPGYEGTPTPPPRPRRKCALASPYATSSPTSKRSADTEVSRLTREDVDDAEAIAEANNGDLLLQKEARMKRIKFEKEQVTLARRTNDRVKSPLWTQGHFKVASLRKSVYKLLDGKSGMLLMLCLIVDCNC